MKHRMSWILGLAAAVVLVIAASAQPAAAAPPTWAYRQNVLATSVPNRFPGNQWQARPLDNGGAPIGSDWWKIYPWSPYNAWKNPYWYPPYNTNYPYPPNQAYPYNPYPAPQPYPAPPLPPAPWGSFGSGNR